MKNEMKMVAVLALLTSFSGAVKADMVFKKNADPSVILTLKDDQTATITKSVGEETTTLAEGTIQGDAPVLIIAPGEEEVCPPVSVKLNKNLATVRDMTEEGGRDARRYCSGRDEIINGSYRIE